ncbi:MAG: hypothetical protein ACTH8J_06020 [Specibacter sp.]
MGQELAGVWHDCRRVTAHDQRNLQRFCAGLHAHTGTARRRPVGRADHCHPCRPGTHGRQPSLHRGHRHRRERHAAHRVQPDGPAPHWLAPGLLVQCRLHLGRRRRHDRESGGEDQGAAQLLHHRRHVPALRRDGQGQRLQPQRAL